MAAMVPLPSAQGRGRHILAQKGCFALTLDPRRLGGEHGRTRDTAHPSRDIMAAADPLKLSSPRIYLVRMGVFLVLVAFLVFILNKTLWLAFLANPGLNGLIVGVLFIGIVLAVRQVARLFREVRWVNNVRKAADGVSPGDPPVLLAPMASLIGERIGRAGVPTATLSAVLDSIGTRLDENREIIRYLAGLLVFLGLLGTFWGLIETVGSVGKVIQSMRTGADAGVLFDELKSGLAAPLAGMGLSFSASLFGLAGSLVLGFLDLQAGQAQNRFYTELEDWLATMARDVSAEAPSQAVAIAATSPDMSMALERLSAAIGDSGGGRAATHAMANLAEGIQGLVQHMRSEQQMIRDWVEAQAAQQKEMKRLLERLAVEHERERIG
jgi:hypothetical protein